MAIWFRRKPIKATVAADMLVSRRIQLLVLISTSKLIFVKIIHGNH
jgi:hypothetical protein